MVRAWVRRKTCSVRYVPLVNYFCRSSGLFEVPHADAADQNNHRPKHVSNSLDVYQLVTRQIIREMVSLVNNDEEAAEGSRLEAWALGAALLSRVLHRFFQLDRDYTQVRTYVSFPVVGSVSVHACQQCSIYFSCREAAVKTVKHTFAQDGGHLRQRLSSPLRHLAIQSKTKAIGRHVVCFLSGCTR